MDEAPNTLFGAAIPRGPDIRIEIKITFRQGGHVLAWQGNSESSEIEIHEAICTSRLVSQFVKKAARRERVKPDKAGLFTVPAKIVCFENGQAIHTVTVEIPIMTMDEDSGEDFQKKAYRALLKANVEISRSYATNTRKMNEAIINQQKELPNQIKDIVSSVVDSGQKAISAAAKSSADIMTASIEPLKTAFGLVKDAYTHESTRADKASDCVIRMLNSKPEEKSMLDDASKLVALGGPLLALIREAKKVVN